jgi:hypothetical protein
VDVVLLAAVVVGDADLLLLNPPARAMIPRTMMAMKPITVTRRTVAFRLR